MKRQILSILFALLALGACAECAFAQTTTVTASHERLAGFDITTGWVELTPVGGSLAVPIAFADATGAQNGPTAFRCKITNGAITGMVQNDGTVSGTCAVPDSAQTVPANLEYSVQICDTSTGLRTSGKCFTLTAVPGITGTSWPLDHYGPSVSTPNIQTVQFAQAATNPSTCIAPYFFTNTATHLSYTCIAGTLVALNSGAQGPAATVMVGTVTTSAAGGNAAVANVGTPTAAVLNFTIPRGPAGPTGATGPAGANGTNGTNGATGPQGPAGATIAVGTTTTGASGSSASVTNVGTTSAAVLNFSIPQGVAGPPATFRGAWASGTTYAVGDVVSRTISGNTASYASLISSNTGNAPESSPSDWGVTAQGGGISTSALANVLGGVQPVSPNVFHSATALSNTLIIPADGTTSSYAGFTSTAKMPITAGQKFITNVTIVDTGKGYAFYDQNGAFVSGSGAGVPAGTQVTAPSGAFFFAFTFTGSSSGVMVIVGTNPTIPSSFVSPYTYDSATIDTNIAAAQAAAVTTAGSSVAGRLQSVLAGVQPVSPNVFHLESILSNTIVVASTGAHESASGYISTGLMPIAAGQKFVTNETVIDGYSGYAFYNVDGTYISGSGVGVTPGTQVTAPTGAFFFAFTLGSGPSSTTMVLVGSNPTLPTSFVSNATYDTATIDAKLLSNGGIKPFLGKRGFLTSDSLGSIWIQGMQDAGIVSSNQYPTSLTRRGAYNSGTAYSVLDSVYESGVYYDCIQAGTGHDPATSPTYWHNSAADVDIVLWPGEQSGNAFAPFQANYAAQPAGPTVLQQLETALLNKSLVVIGAGSNELGVPLGSFGDAPINPGTTSGNINSTDANSTWEYVAQTMLTAVAADEAVTGHPITVVWGGAYKQYRAAASAGWQAPIVAGVGQVTAEYGIPYINLYTEFPINSFTESQYLLLDGDGSSYIHPNNFGNLTLGAYIGHRLDGLAQQ